MKTRKCNFLPTFIVFRISLPVNGYSVSFLRHWSIMGWSRRCRRGLPVGNAICFIRLFYKPDVQFVLEDLMMDYSVISQIIRITKEKKKEERQLGTLVSNYPLDSIVLGISQCGQKARLKGGMEREAQMVIYFFCLLLCSLFSDLQILYFCQQYGEFK